ncbi:MAG: carbohydrate porin [Bdellovibrionales bacterium]|nr:carbohydrate porin [Bdellovibrionales bacterium]
MNGSHFLKLICCGVILSGVVETAYSEEPEIGWSPSWRNYRSKLEEKGYSLNISYKGDYVSNLNGGIEQRSSYLGNLDITADFDLEKLWGAKGLTFSVYGLGNHGGNPTEFIGDSFATSNIEAPETFKIYEVYFQQGFGETSFLVFGLRDLNADFYALDEANILINSAFGISPTLSQTGIQGPSIFPQASVALEYKYGSSQGVYFQSGIFNAQAGKLGLSHGTQINLEDKEGYLYLGEIGYANENVEQGFKKY